jgi:hypothetical protein
MDVRSLWSQYCYTLEELAKMKTEKINAERRYEALLADGHSGGECWCGETHSPYFPSEG